MIDKKTIEILTQVVFKEVMAKSDLPTTAAEADKLYNTVRKHTIKLYQTIQSTYNVLDETYNPKPKSNDVPFK